MRDWVELIDAAAGENVLAEVILHNIGITVRARKGSWNNRHLMSYSEVREATFDVVGHELSRVIKSVRDAYDGSD